ncbi:MAG: fructosamine kinase family protein [Myxococcota bacterium]
MAGPLDWGVSAECARALAGIEAEPIVLSGGDVSQVYRVGDRVVKLLPGAPSEFFASEARGLRRLAAAGAPVPRVRRVAADGIVMDWLEPGPTDWGGLGRVVAALHARPAPTYGTEHPQFLGRFRFGGGTDHDVTRFLVERRLRPLLKATRPTLGRPRADRVARFLDELQLVPEGPREVHGDLWAGNVLHTQAGPMLIDPSAQGAERAYDLSMMKLFGGFPKAFWRAYEAELPLTEAAREALPAHELVFVLVHVAMFGASYCAAVDRLV